MKQIFTKNFTILFIGFCFLLPALRSIAQEKWTLAKNKNGIKVYTSVGGTSKFKSIKVEALLTGTMERMLYLLTDAASTKEWIYNTKESYVIRRINAMESISYTETEVPWPASNRDLPLHVKLNYDPDTNVLQVIARGVPNEIPVKKNIVRIPYFNGFWNIKFDGRSKLDITYFLEVDPGGSVPAWITNLFVAKGPFETFNNLAAILIRK